MHATFCKKSSENAKVDFKVIMLILVLVLSRMIKPNKSATENCYTDRPTG